MDVYKECLHYQHKINHKFSCIQKFSTFFRQKICRKFDVPYIECFITTKCNLKCKHCSNLIPYIEQPEHIPFVEFKRDLDTLLSKVDRLYRLKLHGGEVFLHPELCDIIGYADSLKRIKSIRIATNGTIVPSEKVLKALADSKVIVHISDYPSFSLQADKTVELMRSYGVKFLRLQGQKWQDMGEIKKRGTNRYGACMIARCTSLYRGKIYVCSRAAMLEEFGCRFYDGIDINAERKILRKELVQLFGGKHNKACFYCDGDTEFAKEIPAGEQLS